MLNSAIISVYDKTGLKDFLEGLHQITPEIKIFSSGGTARKIDELGYDVIEISSYTGFPESPGGLVKTLHPKVHGGILLDKSRLDERKYLEENGILTFGLVVCNLYPFKEVSSSGAPKEERSCREYRYRRANFDKVCCQGCAKARESCSRC